MEVFTVIDDALAIIRKKSGTYSQVKLYNRIGKVYCGIGSGFIEIRQKSYQDEWATSDPNTVVVDFELPSWHTVNELGQTRLRFGAHK